MAKRKFSPAEVAEALQKTRGIKVLAAQALQCHRKTVERYIRRYPEVREAYEESKDILVDIAEMKLTAAVDAGEWPAVHFTLVTLGKERGYDEHAEAQPDDDEDWSEFREAISTAYGISPGDLPGGDDEEDVDADEWETGDEEDVDADESALRTGEAGGPDSPRPEEETG